MTKRRFFHRSLFYNGDWHTKLIRALTLAKAATCSRDIHAAIESLEKLLVKIDECKHTVTIIREVPKGLDANKVLQQVQAILEDEHAYACLKRPDAIELTLTARGSERYVSLLAESLMSDGISTAKAEVWVRLQFGETRCAEAD